MTASSPPATCTAVATRSVAVPVLDVAHGGQHGVAGPEQTQRREASEAAVGTGDENSLGHGRDCLVGVLVAGGILLARRPRHDVGERDLPQGQDLQARTDSSRH